MMRATYHTRYGYSNSVSEADLQNVMNDLLEELRTEESDAPDDEHTQVSVGNEHYAVTAQVSGLITFDNFDILEGLESPHPEVIYLRDVPDSDLKAIWAAVLAHDHRTIFSYPWAQFDELPPYSRDFYRDAS
jgi:hypothetical protein